MKHGSVNIMPGLDVHAKYARKLGIPEEVSSVIDRYIDRRDQHDFWDKFIERDIEVVGIHKDNVIVRFKFKGLEFLNSNYYKFMSRYGHLGLKVFFLHILLDVSERIARPKDRSLKSLINHIYTRRWYYIQFCDKDNIFSDVIDEVINALRKHLYEVKEDLRYYEARKGKPYIKNVIWEIIHPSRCI